MPQASNYVSGIRGSYGVVAMNVSASLATSLRILGGIQERQGERTIWLLHATDEATLSTLLMSLRDLGLSFSIGYGWSPADVFEWLRERGMIDGSYQQIAWCGPDDWTIASH